MAHTPSDPLRRYLADVATLSGLGSFVFQELGHVARDLSAGVSADPSVVAHSPELAERLTQSATRLQSWSTLTGHLCLCRFVDQYFTYLSELVATLLVARPAAQTVSPRSSAIDLTRVSPDRRVDELAFSSIEELAEAFQSLFGLSLFEGPEEQAAVSRLVALRSLFSHRRGVVTRQHLAALGLPISFVGRTLSLSSPELGEGGELLKAAAIALDARAQTRFRLS